MFLTPSSLEDSIVHTISWSLKVPAHRLNWYTHLRDDLLLDTLDVQLLIVTLESHLNVFLSEEEADAIETVGDFKRHFIRYTA